MSRGCLTLVMTVVVASTFVACAARVAPATVLDAQTGVRAKTALVNDPELGVHPIEVRVVNGVARLSGRVPTEADANRAVALVRAVAGVVEVRSELRVGGDPDERPATASAVGSPGAPDTDVVARVTGAPAASGTVQEAGLGDTGDRRLFAVGASVGWNGPPGETLDTNVSLGPLVRVGNGRGLGVSIGFGWFGSELRSALGDEEVVGQVRIRPVMAGLGYTVGDDQATMSLSVVGGVSINSIVASDELSGRLVPLQVRNSLAWRPGASLWFETSARTALNISLGYVMTRPRLTLLDGSEIVRRRLTADAFLLRVGIVYKVF